MSETPNTDSVYPEEENDRKQLSELEINPEKVMDNDGSREVNPEIMRATFRLVDEDPDPTDVYEDLGGGDPERRRQASLEHSLGRDLEVIETEYDPARQREPFMVELYQGLVVARRLAKSGSRVNIPKFVEETLDAYTKTTDATNRESVKFFAQQCDAGLAKLKNALFRDREDLIHTNPSPAWDNPVVREAVTHSIDTSSQIFQVLRPRRHDEDDTSYTTAIERYIEGVQNEFLAYAGVDKPAHGDSLDKKRGRKLSVKRRRATVAAAIKSGPGITLLKD